MKSQVLKFASVGVLNTGVDFLIFALLTSLLDIHYVAANIISTGAALSLSFFLNGRVTFKSQLTRKSVALFLATTLTGLWILQPIVIALFQPITTSLESGFGIDGYSLLAAKAIATVFSLVWNFFTYKYIVFPKSTSVKER